MSASNKRIASVDGCDVELMALYDGPLLGTVRLVEVSDDYPLRQELSRQGFGARLARSGDTRAMLHRADRVMGLFASTELGQAFDPDLFSFLVVVKDLGLGQATAAGWHNLVTAAEESLMYADRGDIAAPRAPRVATKAAQTGVSAADDESVCCHR
jgi:hypothetical protein